MKKFRRILSLVLCAVLLCTMMPGLRASAATSSFAPTVAEWDVIRRVNQAREEQGLEPLTAFAAIQDAADIRAEELGTSFAHDRPDGRKFYTVLEDTGISYNNAHENIAYGFSTAAAVMNAWMNSSGHYANIMTEKATHIGVGKSGTFWVQLFVGSKKDTYKNYFEVIVREPSYEAGTTIEEMDMYAILVSSVYGDCYLPILSSYCTGYDPNTCGTQTVTVSALGFTDVVTITISHKEVADPAVAASCTQTGLTVGSHCETCGKVIVKQTVIPAKGHSYQSVVTAPTCGAEGYTTYTCTACGSSYKADYTKATGRHTYSSEYDESCNVCGYVREVEVKIVPMYRLYNPNSGEHFYTGSLEERNNLVKAGWNYEGIGWNAPVKGGEPVYRLYNPNSGDHHYTMSWDEVEMLKGYGWRYEGVAWNSAGSEPQYRLYNPNADCGSHHYTSSLAERNNLVSLGWILEGIGWYGIPN